MFHEFTTAFVLGIVGWVIPGPVLTATFTEILQSGLWRSFRIIFMAMFTETVVAFTSLVLLASLGLPESFFRGISLFGAGILLWIAPSLWRITSLDTDKKVYFGFWKISAMILANWMLWTYWITVCIPQAIFLGKEIPFGSYLFLVLVEIWWLVSTWMVAFIFSRFRKILSWPKTIPMLFKIFACAFVYFAVNMIYQSMKFFMK